MLAYKPMSTLSAHMKSGRSRGVFGHRLLKPMLSEVLLFSVACREACEAKGAEPLLANVGVGPRGDSASWRPRMSPLPTGTVTFLFTDIEGSTTLLQRLGDHRYAEVLAEHQRLLRDAFAEGHGQVVDTQGDAFLVAFHRARDAVATAVAAQQALAKHRWPDGASLRVRMALHTGEPLSGETGYVGIDVHRAARIAAGGHGGQILLSDAVSGLAARDLPPGVSLRDLGAHRLKDLKEPEHLFQVVHPDLPAEFSLLKSLDVLPNNLPRQLTSFIGRERQIADVQRLLSSAYVVTLTGAGGVGKTRLALQLGAALLPQYPDGVWFVELASLSDPVLVTKTVATALGVPEQPGRGLTETLADFLRARHLLLLLDNCEHVVDACGDLADKLLRACSNLRILATSRQALGIQGESTYRLPSLELPDPDHLPPLAALADYEAVRLFVERAILSQSNFLLTASTAPAVAQICHQLDGIPLAIELAAARVKVLSVEQIASRLGDRFRLLKGGARTDLPRQRTLQAAMNWSHDLLSDKERVVLRRLAVFAGGWLLAAAEAVCAGDGVEASEILDLLSQLVDKSLVIGETQGAMARYRLLETVRQYGLDKLLESGEAYQIRSRHRDWYLALAEQAKPEWSEADRDQWLGRLEAEHDNLRAALAWSLEESAELGLRLGIALMRFWHQDHYEEGRAWLTKLLAISGQTSPLVRARGFNSAASLAWTQGDFRHAVTLSEKGLTLSRQVEDKSSIAHALYIIGVTGMALGDYDRAARVLEESQDLYQDLDDKERVANALRHRGHAAVRQGNYPLATALLGEALLMHQAMGNKAGVAFSLRHLGVMKHYQRDTRQAMELLEQSLALFREIRNAEGTMYALTGLGSAVGQEGNHSRALSLFRESLALSKKHGIKWATLESLYGLAGVSACQGQPERAARLLGAAELLRRTIDYSLPLPDQTDYERSLTSVRAALSDTSFAAAWAEGHAMTLEQTIEYALAEV
jgi:predicted ATPase/class 3 adenylate cyclase